MNAMNPLVVVAPVIEILSIAVVCAVILVLALQLAGMLGRPARSSLIYSEPTAIRVPAMRTGLAVLCVVLLGCVSAVVLFDAYAGAPIQ